VNWSNNLLSVKTCPKFDKTAQDSKPEYRNRESERLATAPSRHRTTAPPRHRATAQPGHRATGPPRHRATAPLHQRATTNKFTLEKYVAK